MLTYLNLRPTLNLFQGVGLMWYKLTISRPELVTTRRDHNLFQTTHTSKVRNPTQAKKPNKLSPCPDISASGVTVSQQRLRHRIYPHLSLARPAAKCVQPAPPGLPGPQSFLFCVVRCCSWYSLESSQGRGPRMFFHSSKLTSFIFYRVGEKTPGDKGLNSGSHTIFTANQTVLKSVQDFSTLKKYYDRQQKPQTNIQKKKTQTIMSKPILGSFFCLLDVL